MQLHDAYSENIGRVRTRGTKGKACAVWQESEAEVERGAVRIHHCFLTNEVRVTTISFDNFWVSFAQ